jgi:hypothetical protein
LLGDLVGTAFRPCEDERPSHSRIAEKLDEKIALAACFNEHDGQGLMYKYQPPSGRRVETVERVQ